LMAEDTAFVSSSIVFVAGSIVFRRSVIIAVELLSAGVIATSIITRGGALEVFGFDSFKGLPENWCSDGAKRAAGVSNPGVVAHVHFNMHLDSSR